MLQEPQQIEELTLSHLVFYSDYAEINEHRLGCQELKPGLHRWPQGMCQAGALVSLMSFYWYIATGDSRLCYIFLSFQFAVWQFYALVSISTVPRDQVWTKSWFVLSGWKMCPTRANEIYSLYHRECFSNVSRLRSDRWNKYTAIKKMYCL